MAFTTSNLLKTVFGNERVFSFRVTADGLSGTVSTGLQWVDTALLCPQSLSTGAIKVAINELTSGTANAGSVAITGAVSGDEFLLTVFGR